MSAAEQYRAGFEAWADRPENDLSTARATWREGYIDINTDVAWNAWVAAKSEASTEPVGWVDDGGMVFWTDGKPPADGSDLFTVAAGALSDDAKAVIDAARKLVQCKGRYHTELNFRELSAAIEAHNAGSGT